MECVDEMSLKSLFEKVVYDCRSRGCVFRQFRALHIRRCNTSMVPRLSSELYMYWRLMTRRPIAFKRKNYCSLEFIVQRHSLRERVNGSIQTRLAPRPDYCHAVPESVVEKTPPGINSTLAKGRLVGILDTTARSVHAVDGK